MNALGAEVTGLMRCKDSQGKDMKGPPSPQPQLCRCSGCFLPDWLCHAVTTGVVGQQVWRWTFVGIYWQGQNVGRRLAPGWHMVGWQWVMRHGNSFNQKSGRPCLCR